MKVANKEEMLKKTAGFSTEMSSTVASLLEEILLVEDDRKFVLAKHIKSFLVNVYQVEEKFEEIITAYNQLAEQVNGKHKQTTDMVLDIDNGGNE